jgi:Yip1 domain
MPNSTVSTGAPAAPMGLVARLIGVVTSPRETFQAVAAHPKWFGVLAVVTCLMAFFAALPMTTDAGKEAAIRSNVEQMESFGMTVSDEAYEGMRRGMAIAPYTTAGAILVFTPFMTLVFAGIFFLVFNAVLGGDASFKQLFAVMAHASVISALQQIFTGPVNYFRGAVTSATNLTALLPMFEPTSFIGRVLAMTDLFLIWYVLVLSIGLGVLYRRRTQPIAMTLYGIYAVGVLVLAAVMSRMGGA